LQRLSTALNILEKYGCNLTNPNRPKYWRTVKHNNPVFRATVDAIQGGRNVLCLYGYSNQQPDGLSFPDDVIDPDVGRVAAVTLEVMSLRTELEMLIKEAHPHPEFYERIIPTLRHKDVGLNTEAVVFQDSPASSQPSSQTKSLGLPHLHRSTRESSRGRCLLSDRQNLRSTQVFSTSSNKHPETSPNCSLFQTTAASVRSFVYLPIASLASRASAQSVTDCITPTPTGPTTAARLSHPNPPWRPRGGAATSEDAKGDGHRLSPLTVPLPLFFSPSTWCCLHCLKVNSLQEVLCEECELPRTSSFNSKADESQPKPEWHCKSCTMVNAASSVLCEVCERPRLATRPPATPSHKPANPPRPPAPVLGMPGDPDSQVS
ncbi:unnamed protein product, partial [Tetraodon nigroviridis]